MNSCKGYNYSFLMENMKIKFPSLLQNTHYLRKNLKATSFKIQVINYITLITIFRSYMKDALKKAQKNGDLTEDDLRDLENQAQKVTDESIKNIDKITEDKEKEVLEG